jgi:Gas vesicle synthesis protein GvpO
VNPRELLDAARTTVAEFTGRRVETVSGLRRDGDDKSWVVTVEVLELQRIPNTMDLLASYAVTLSEDGEVLGFERERRYHRAAADDTRG